MTVIRPTISSFFAGIGGFDLGFEREGFRTVFQCEINEFCQTVLGHHWPNVVRSDDIRLIEPSFIPDSDVWCGGFPCQDVSVARGAKGREGLKGQNSGLFYSFLELIQARKPNIVLLENVVGLLSSHNGQDFRIILEQLTKIGYSVAWRIKNSRYYGAPQSRPRVFICASLIDSELPLKALYEEIPGTKPRATRAGFLKEDMCEFSGARVPKVAYCLAATSGRHTGTDWSRTYISYKSSVRRLIPSECEGLQGFPRDWTNIQILQSKDNYDYDYDYDTPRYHALGNAVAVPVIQWIAARIRAAMMQLPKSTNGITIDETVSRYPDFKSRYARTFILDELHYATKPNGHSLKWQSGGYARNGHCIDIKAPEAPSAIIEQPLIDIIERTKPASHYYLSPNAAEGILRRVDSQNRTLFGPMDAALRNMVRQANRKRA